MNDDSTILPHIDETVRRDFEDAWRLGHPKPIERLLTQAKPGEHHGTAEHDTAEHLDTLEELVHIELEFAWKERSPIQYGETAGELWRPHVEDYLQRFPELQQPAIVLRLIEQEYRVRDRNGDTPTPDEFQQRFSTFVSNEELESRLNKIAQRGERRPELPGYVITNVLGRGGMGIVYKAQHEHLKRTVAIKMLLSGSLASEDELQRFRAEAEVVAQLHHPNIVQIYDVGEHEGMPFFSLEYVDGGTLAQQIGHDPQPGDVAASIVQTLASAVDQAHQAGIVHRDLKPANVLRDGDGTLKIGDFGLAKNLQDDGRTNTGAVMGTPSYMSPEQAAAQNEKISPATDVYALGAMLYHMLTGSPPFRGETPWDVVQQLLHSEPVGPRQLQPKIARDLETICLKCLQKEPSRRYATAADLAADLGRFLAKEPIVARPVSTWERTAKWMKRRPALAGLIAVSTLAMLTITIGSLVYTSQLREYSTKLEGERTRANIARNEANANAKTAQQQTQLALSTLRSVVFDIQRELDGRMGMQNLQQRLLQKAQQGLDRVARTAETADTTDYTLAAAFAEISQIYEIVGRTEDAERFSKRAVEMFESLAEASPNGEEAHTSLAVALRTLGDVQQQRGDLAAAKSSLERSFALRRDLVKAQGDAATLQDRHLLVTSRVALARVIDSRGETEKAFAEYDDCIEQLESLSKIDGDSASLQRDLAAVLGNRGNLHLKRTKPSNGLVDFLRARQIRQALVDAAPEAERLSFEVSLSYSHRDLGRLYMALGEVESSIAAWRQCLNIARRWSEADPLNTTAQQSLAHAFTGIGLGLLESGDLSAAQTNFVEADRIREKLFENDPADATSASYRSVALGHLASTRLLIGDVAGAEQAAESGREILASLMNRDTTNEVLQRDLLACRRNLASVYLKRERIDDSLELILEDAERVDELLEKRPTDLQLMTIAVGIFELLGDVHRQREKFNNALIAYGDCERLAAAMAELEPNSKATLNAEEVTQDRLGDVYREQLEFDKAERHYRESLAVSKQRWELDRENSTAHRYVALSHEKLARLFLAAEEYAKADAEYQVYSEIMAKLVEQYPDNAVFLHEKAVGHNLHADVKQRLGDTPAAKTLYDASLDAASEYLAAYPKHAFAMTDMAIALEKLADLQAAPKERLRLLTEATGFRRQVAAAQGSQLADTGALSLNLMQMGQALLQQGSPQEALGHFQEGLQIRQRTAQRFPNAASQSKLGFAHLRVAEARQAMQETEQARTAFNDSLVAFRKSRDAIVDSESAKKQLAQKHVAVPAFHLAELEFGETRYEVAAKLFEEARLMAEAANMDEWTEQFAARQKIAAALPPVILDLAAVENTPPEIVLVILKTRGLNLVKAGNRQAAIETAEKLAQMRPTDPVALHASARLAAYCQQIAVNNPELAKPAEEHLALTLSFLNQMRDHGYFEIAREARIDNIETDPAFKGMRDIEAFREFLDEVRR